VLGDQCEYESELGKSGGEIDIPDVVARIVQFLDQDGRDLILRDSPCKVSRDGLDDLGSPSDVPARLKSPEPSQAGPSPSRHHGLRGLGAWLLLSESPEPPGFAWKTGEAGGPSNGK